jgi:hypothetical protein
MKKRIVLPVIMVFAIIIHLVFIERSVQAEETASYGEDTAAYGEETAGYWEESAAYGDEAAQDGSAKPFVPAISAEEAPTMVSKDQPRSLDELIMWYDASSCQECHEEIYEAWENSPHAKPLMGINNLVFLGPVLKKGYLAVKHPKDATKRNFPCFKCHLPQAMNVPNSVYAQITRAIFANNKEILSQLTISCVVCHNEMPITHKLIYGRPEENVIYGTQDFPEHEDDIYTSVKKSVIMKRAVMCGQCHGLGPNLEFENPVQCATLYGSYLHNYISGGGAKSCQECHMADGDHSFSPDFNRKKETSDRLAESISLEVEMLSYQFLGSKKQYISTVAVNTKIRSAAGHRIPDG